MNLIPFSALALQPTTAAEKQTLHDAIHNISGIVRVQASEITDYLWALAETCNIDLDTAFLNSAIAAASGLGEANPQLPNTACRARNKVVFERKIKPGPDLPGVSGVSVPIARRFDWTGAANDERAAFFLCAAVADEAWQVLTIAERIIANDAFAKALEQIIDNASFAELKNAIEKRLAEAGQTRGVDQLEKQIYVPIDAEADKYLVATPLMSQLPGELDRRLRERKEIRGQHFDDLYFEVDGSGGGLSHRLLGGRLPRLMCLPPVCSEYVRGKLPGAARGRYLVIEFDAPKMNASGNDISAGFSLIGTAAQGFADALRRQHPKIGGVEAVAVGLSNAEFHGELNDDGKWTYVFESGIKKSNGKAVHFGVPELKASARVHLVLRLIGEIKQGVIDADSIGSGMRFCGSNIFNLEVAVADDEVLGSIFAKWGDVHMLADRSEYLLPGVDKLDVLLDLIAADGFVPIGIGYQGIEPARPRHGVRGEEGQKHMFCMSITGAGEFVSAEQARHDSIFWRWEYNRVRYNAIIRT